MTYYREILLKDGRNCILRNAEEKDAREVLEIFNLTHRQTDYLLSYPGEEPFSVEEEAEYLRNKSENENGIEIIAEVDGRVVASAGIEQVSKREKIRHRAEFGIGVDKDCWGLGIGTALLEACIECAKKAGFTQLELTVVADNERAVSLYKKAGFTEFGRNPKGFRSRSGEYRPLVYMLLDTGD